MYEMILTIIKAINAINNRSKAEENNQGFNAKA